MIFKYWSHSSKSPTVGHTGNKFHELSRYNTYIQALGGVHFLYLSYISIKLRFKILEKGGVGGVNQQGSREKEKEGRVREPPASANAHENVKKPTSSGLVFKNSWNLMMEKDKLM